MICSKSRNHQLFLLFLLINVCFCLSCSDSDSDSSRIQKGDFEETTALLSTPELLDKFFKDYIHYSNDQQYDIAEQYGWWWKFPEETYEDGFGYCYDLSAFALYCLLKNGFDDARLLFACFGNWGEDGDTGHFVTVFDYNGRDYIFDNGSLRGPFDDFEDILKIASRGNNILYHRFFSYEEIAFHTPYDDMDYFCSP